MRNFLILVLISTLAFIIAGSLSYPLYEALDLREITTGGRFTKWFALIAIAIAMTLVIKLRSTTAMVILGFSPPPAHRWITLGKSYLLGIAILSPYALTLYALDILVGNLSYPADELAIKILLYIPVTFLIATLEEIYFRGILFYDLQRNNYRVLAVILPSLLYSFLHFLNAKGHFPPDVAGWQAGLTLLAQAPAYICTGYDCWGAAITLFLFGIFLAMLRLNGASLFTCIGVHAGCILVIKTSKKLTDWNGNSELSWLAQGPDHFIGLLSACIFLVLIIIYLFFNHQRQKPLAID